MQSKENEVYFKCPNCSATYGYKEFFELVHTAEASPSDGPDALGHAICRKCTKDFYYSLTSDVIPIVVNKDPLKGIPDEILYGDSNEEATYEPLEGAPTPAVTPEPGGKDQTGQKGSQEDKMGQFKEALNGIDSKLPPPELAKRISEALEVIVTEPRPQVEAAFDLLRQRFGLNARKIEAFRHEMKLKREEIETDRKTKELHEEVAKSNMPPKEVAGEEEENALAYLKDPNLFENISRDIAEAGEVVGEETNKMMLYLAATSRKFKKPISLVVFGKSSSGKSYLANRVAEFMPQEDRLILSSLTAKALEYSNGKLKHKFILIQEWEGAAETLPTLRVLLSEGKLARYVPKIDPVTKKHVSVADEQESPCSVVVTTTKEDIHNENATRIFELYVEESLEKIRKVVRATLDKADMTRRMSHEEKRKILDLHQNAQRLLEPVEVNIPFAEHLSFPARTSRHQRDSERFLNLIRAVAFLRQKQKGQFKTLKGEKYVDAEFVDYKIAYTIGLDIIRATLNNISNRSKDALRVCCDLNDEYLKANKASLFTVTDIQNAAAKLGLDFSNRQDLYKQLDKLEEYEYLERRQARKNAVRHYKVLFAYERNEAGEIINIDLPDIKEILTPEQLQEKLKTGRCETAVGTEPQPEGVQAEGYFAKFEGSNEPKDEGIRNPAPNPRDRYVLRSALQKAIRWCEIKDARYFAKEFIEIGISKGTLKRLMKIAAEDIGLADPTLLKYVGDCLDIFKTKLKEYKTTPGKVSGFPEICAVIDRAVIAAALSHKSRLLAMLSFATLFEIYKREDFKHDLGEYANRFRTAIKKQDEKEAAYYAYILGLILDYEDSLFEIIQEESKTRNTKLIEEWTHEYKRTKERLMLAGIISLLCRDLNYPHGEYRDQVSDWLSLPIENATIPDRAYDMHTRARRTKGRGLEHFFNEGASVKNERFPNNWKELGEKAYFEAQKEGLEKSEKVIGAIKKKLENIRKGNTTKKFIIDLPFKYKRAALTQARTKKDSPFTFIAELNDGSRKFIKGPFKNTEQVWDHYRYNEVKRRLESKYLHPIQCQILELGSQNEVFLVCDELGKADLNKVEEKRTDLDGTFEVLAYASNDVVPDPLNFLTEPNV